MKRRRRVQAQKKQGSDESFEKLVSWSSHVCLLGFPGVSRVDSCVSTGRIIVQDFILGCFQRLSGCHLVLPRVCCQVPRKLFLTFLLVPVLVHFHLYYSA